MFTGLKRYVVVAMTKTVVVDDNSMRQTGNGYGNLMAAAAEWSFRASSQCFRSRPINRLYWTSYDIIMLLCAMDSDSGAARALFIIAVVVVAYTMSVLIELVNRARRKLRGHVYIYIYIYTHTHTARIYTGALEPYYNIIYTLSVLAYRIL